MMMMMTMMMIIMAKPCDYDDDTDYDHDHKNDRYIVAGAALGASVPYSLFIHKDIHKR